MNFLGSPSIVTAMAFSGKLSFNPVTDTITTPSGGQFKFKAPVGLTLPEKGFESGTALFNKYHTACSFLLGNPAFYPAPNPVPQPDTPIVISPTSSRLEVLKPFESHFPGNVPAELPPMKCLMRVRGKCTTDHISAAVSSCPLCLFNANKR